MEGDTHTTDYSAISTPLTTESMDWDSLEQIWKDLQKSTKEDPKWMDFWKSLDNWACNNINQDTLPKTEWNRMQVAAWARKVLEKFEKSAEILIEQEIDGDGLLKTSTKEELLNCGIPLGSANKLWAEIEKMKESSLAKLDITQSLEKFIFDSPNLLPPPLNANKCSICKLPLEPKKISLPGREAMKYSVDTTLNAHWFCLPDESIFNREEAALQLQMALKNNIEAVASKTKQDHIFCTAIGFVGIGKTTVGQHVASKLHHNGKPVKYVYIDFSNGDGIDELQQDDKNSFVFELSLRIITRLFKDHSYEHAYQRFPKQLTSLKEDIRVHTATMTLTQILETWYKHHAEEYAAIVLHFDEINYLQEKAREYLVAYIGAAMAPQSDASNSANARILPLLTGTTASTRGTVKLSTYGHVTVSLSALSDDAQYKLVLFSVDEPLRLKLQEDNKFKMVIKSTLGVPRLVMQLRRAVLEELRVPGTANTWGALLNAIANKFLNYVGQTYIVSTWREAFPSSALILRLICVCLRGKLSSILKEENGTSKVVVTITVPGFDQGMTHIPGMDVSVSFLRDGGFIHTSDTGNPDGQVDVLMPYCLLSSLICSAQTYQPIQSSIIAPISNLTWQELEELELHFLKLFVSAFNAMGSNLLVTFRDIWRGAVAQEDILGLKIKIPTNGSFCYGKEAEQWIDRKLTIRKALPYVKLDSNEMINLEVKNGVFLACANNPLFDVRSKFEIDAPTIQAEENLPFEPVPSDENPKQRRIKSQTGQNKAPKMVTKSMLLNLVQMKASADPKAKITASKICAWYTDAQKLIFPEEYKVVFTYFTNKNMEWDIKENDVSWTMGTLLDCCPNLVLMSREQLVTYLSPMFAPLCLPKD